MTKITPAKQLANRYSRVADQLIGLFEKTDDTIARMATATALLHHKMPHYFWTGFYRLIDDQLVVGPYQGPVACAVLPGPDGVCWACVNRKEAILVRDVEAWPGHVACDARSKSELVVPVYNSSDSIVGVFDIDSDQLGAFTEVDLKGVQRIVQLIK